MPGYLLILLLLAALWLLWWVVMEPRGMVLDPFDLSAYARTVMLPGVVLLFALATVARQVWALDPVTVIERRPGWQLIDLNELWRHRELLYFLIWRDVKVRYKQTALGAAWAIIQPVVNMIIFTVIFGQLAHLK